MIWDKLKEPFDPALISWRIGSTNKKSEQRNDPKAKATKGIALAYINARDVMNRLDEVVGPGGWSDKYFETTSGRLMCEITILDPDTNRFITKSDGAGDSDIEGEKGAISDAFKRAAVKFGVGRYLYDLPNSWVELNEKEQIKTYPKLPNWALPGGIQPLKIDRVHRQILKHYCAIASILKCDDSLGLTQLADELVESYGEPGKQLVWSMLDTNEKDQMRKLLAEQVKMESK